jgi:hypothetical protein
VSTAAAFTSTAIASPPFLPPAPSSATFAAVAPATTATTAAAAAAAAAATAHEIWSQQSDAPRACQHRVAVSQQQR